MSDQFLDRLEFEFSLKPSVFSDFSHLLMDFEGRATLWDDDDELSISVLRGHRLDIAAARRDYSNLRQLFDSISPEISDLGEHIVNGNDCYAECCAIDENERTPCGGLVYIDELVVEQDYRGLRVGAEMLRRMSETLDLNQSLVALKAYPILDEEEHRSGELKRGIKEFYRKMGFRHSGEHYMVKDARDCHAQRERAIARATAAG